MCQKKERKKKPFRCTLTLNCIKCGKRKCGQLGERPYSCNFCGKHSKNPKINDIETRIPISSPNFNIKYSTGHSNRKKEIALATTEPRQ